jgi:hypothetical protein
MKKFATVLLSLSATSLLASKAVMPPMPPSFPTGDEVRGTPKSCKTLPMMIVHLPPPMQVEFDVCKNDLHMPFLSKTAQTLVKKFGKLGKVQLTNISVVEGFHRFYKVDFTLNGVSKTIYTNEKLTHFLDSELKEFEEKKEVKKVSSVPVVTKIENNQTEVKK